MAKEIQQRNYLLESLITDERGLLMFTNPDSDRAMNLTKEFRFQINPDINDLIDQCDMFARRVIAQLGYTNRAMVDRFHPDNLTNIKKAYLYSYLKSCFFANLHQNSLNQYTTPQSRVFGGHKYLYESVRRRTSFLYNGQHRVEVSWNVTVSDALIDVLNEYSDLIKKYDKLGKSDLINEDQDSIKLYNSIKDNLVFIVWSESKTSDFDFFNEKNEYVLQHLQESYDKIDIRDLFPAINMQPEEFAVGNTCYSQDSNSKQVLFLSSNSLQHDPISCYWGTAVGLEIIREEKLDNDDRYYKTTNLPDKGTSNRQLLISYEINSITNYLPLSNVSSTYNINKTNNGDDMNGSSGPRPSNSGGGNNPNNNNSRNIGKSGNKPAFIKPKPKDGGGNNPK